MAFEFFFGVFGLISSDSRSRHKSRLENDWRLFTPLSTNLFKDSAGQQKQGAGGTANAGYQPNSASLGGKLGNSLSTGPEPKGAGLFSASSGLVNSSSGQSTVGNVENPFSSSTSSIGSSTGSISTINSNASLIKQSKASGELITGVDSISGRKYEFSSGGSPVPGQQPPPPAAMAMGAAAGGGGGLAGLRVTANMVDERERELSSAGILDKDFGQQHGQQQKRPGSSSGSLSAGDADSGEKGVSRFGQKSREIYCRLVCLFLWLNVFRLGAGLLVEKSLFTLDLYYMGSTKMNFLIPALCLAIQVAAVSTIFIRNNEETNWLVPFYSSKDYLIRSRSNFQPRMKDYTRRVNISVSLALVLAAISSLSLSAYLIHCVFQSDALRSMYGMSASSWVAPLSPSAAASAAAAAGRAPVAAGTPTQPAAALPPTPAASNVYAIASDAASPVASATLERCALLLLLLNNILWSVYATYICFLVSFYFNLICSIMKARFHYISKIIEDLAESNTRKTTNQARKITTLYLEHNEACELLDESNDFWQYLILFTYFTYIPAYCYCLYNLFFVDFAPWPCFITWVIHTHLGFIILLISFSAAGVSTEAHAPYTSLHTLSLIQLPLDVEVNITTFLHRVRGLTIGYSCYDLFAITNASMSNTAAACASYFLIVADFSRSSVFNNAQANGTAPPPIDGSAGAPTTPMPSMGLTATLAP